MVEVAGWAILCLILGGAVVAIWDRMTVRSPMQLTRDLAALRRELNACRRSLDAAHRQQDLLDRDLEAQTEIANWLKSALSDNLPPAPNRGVGAS